MCLTPSLDEPKIVISDTVQDSIINQIREQEIPAVMFGMGEEPLLFKNFVSFVRKIADAGVMDIFLFTNGLLMNEAIATALIDLPITRVYFSIDAATPETFKTDIKFDVILNMEIVEHVENVDFFLKSSSELLRKNGMMFVATLNKTLKSYLFAIIGAEYILNWLPIGTHEWEKFVKPQDLTNILKKYKLNLESLDGMKYNLFNDEWAVSKDKSINYISKFIKS